MIADQKAPAVQSKPGVPVKPGAAKPKVVIEAYVFRKDGLPHIRKAATLFGITLLLSIALVTAGRVVLFKTVPGTAAAHANQSAARERYNQAETERIEIRDFLPKFEQLRARGFFGMENRLLMLEAIQSIQQARHLLPIAFDFSPQQIVAVDPALLAAPLELHSTSVHLRMDMLHEGDLVNFMQDLKGRGFFAAKDCLLSSLDTPVLDAKVPKVTAECTLYWLSIAEPLPDATAPAAP